MPGGGGGVNISPVPSLPGSLVVMYACGIPGFNYIPFHFFSRFFFKTYCEDLQMEILEEYSNNRAVLPLVNGKIVGRVEKI